MLPRLFLVVCLLLSLLPAAQADDKPDTTWSPTVRGLRARVFVTPSHDTMVDKTYDIWIQFQEAGLETSLGLEHRSMTLRFSRAELQVAIAPAKGDPIVAVAKTSDEPNHTWDLIFPPGGSLLFPIGAGGSHPHVVLGQTPPKGRLLSFNSQSEWTVPIDGGPYKLAITLEVPTSGQVPAATAVNASAPASGVTTNTSGTPSVVAASAVGSALPGAPAAVDADAAHKPPYRGWSGTLVLPPIDLPAQ